MLFGRDVFGRVALTHFDVVATGVTPIDLRPPYTAEWVDPDRDAEFENPDRRAEWRPPDRTSNI